ncbi:MAG: PHB depolymerase family esterase [Pseudolysinimonas sp.]
MNRMPRLAVALITAAVALATLSGCGALGSSPAGSGPASTSSAGAIPVGSSSHTIEVDGQSRTYLVYRPTGIPNPSPLVMMLHGGFGSASQAEASYGWDAEADSNRFVVVYPDGQDHAWNVGGGCCGTPGRTNLDDVAFLSAVVGDVEAALPIDKARVFATGMSNGALMAYRLACDTQLFAAIGAVSGTLLGDCPSPHPLSVLAIHGTADQNIPYAGGEGSGAAKIDGPSIPSVNELWRTTDSCEPPTSTVDDQVTTSTANCPDSKGIELITIDGAGHQWPGSTKNRAGGDTPFPGLDATEVIWQFFAAHPATP